MATATKKQTQGVVNIAAAFVGSPYQNAVHSVPLGAAFKDWPKAVHYDWSVDSAELTYKAGGKTIQVKEKVALHRSDTHALLGLVTPKFKPVQPKGILKFYEEVTEEFGFALEAAGQAQGGRKLWALARTPYTIEPLKNDKVNGYLMFLTACDGTSATKLFFISFRLHCLNQLRLIVRSPKARVHKHGTVLMRLTHRRDFSNTDARKALHVMDESWKDFEAKCKALAKLKVDDQEAANFLLHMAYPDKKRVEDLASLRDNSVGARLLETYRKGEGQKAIVGTGWGLVNAVSRFIDHDSRAKDAESRITRAWVASGARMKVDAFEAAVKLVEAK